MLNFYLERKDERQKKKCLAMSNKNPIVSKNGNPPAVGKLFQEMDGTDVTWKIPNFTEKMSGPPGTRYFSTTFAFSDTCWCLSISPNGDSREDSKGYTGLYLDMRAKHSCEFTYTMNIKNTMGGPEFTRTFSSKYDRLKAGAGTNQFCSKSTLMDRKSELLPNDTLTVECRLKRDNSVLIGVSRTERLLNLQTDLKKVLNEKESCDVVLKLDVEEIKAHKVILKNRCKVFESMFSHDMVERKTGEITIDDINPDVFREVLAYMYCGEVENLLKKNMCELYVAADKYNLLELKRICEIFIEENISVDVFCDVLAIPDTCLSAELRLARIDYFCKNFLSIVVTEKWKNFDEKNKEITHKFMFSTIEAKVPKNF